MDFKDFKKNRSQVAENISKLRDEQENKGREFGKDNYFPKQDELGNAYAIVRILPQKDIAKMPIQTNYSHRAKIGNKYINLVCPSTFGTMKDCDLCQEAATEWSKQKESGIDKPDVPSYRVRKELCNVLVIKDDMQPEMVGQVKKFYIPFPLLEKLNYKLMPPKNKEGVLTKQPEMVHDLWEGKNLVIEIRRNKLGNNDYSESHFEAEFTPVGKTEAEIEDIYNRLFTLELEQSKVVPSLVKSWNDFHKLNNGETLDDQKAKTETIVKEKAEKNLAEKIADKKAEDEFSVNDVDTTQSSTSDENLPWD